MLPKLTIKGPDNKRYKLHNLGEVPAIGVETGETFSLSIDNVLYEPVQVRVALDGVDICTGGKATISPEGDMFYIHSRRSLHLQAWPETLRGGAQFVFTSEEMGVAKHLYGEANPCKGYITVVLFRDAKPQSPRFYGLEMEMLRSNCCVQSVGVEPKGISETQYEELTGAALKGSRVPREEAQIAAIGAGSQVEQRLQHVKGLEKPYYAGVVTLKYMLWPELQAKLQGDPTQPPKTPPGLHPLEEQMIDLSRVPKVETYERFV